MAIRRQRDPDRLSVKEHNHKVFLWWLYDEGPSGTLTLSMETAKSLAVDLESIVLMYEERQKSGND